jgi:hypothetical protein
MLGLPPVPSMGLPPEPYATTTKPIGCDPIAKPGVVAFRDWVVERLGGGNGGIIRGCEIGKPSYHHIGSAWDWMVSASIPDDRAKATALLDWLLAGDPDGYPDAMARRAGLVYIIWDRHIWGTWNRDWSPYGGDNPHTDHVHFSFSEDGASGRTSFFRWMGLPEPLEPPEPTPLMVEPPHTSLAAPLAVGALSFAATAAAAYYGAARVRS